MIARPMVCRSFIARSEELAFLHERRLLAAKSHGGIVLVAGEAGIGKSRLLSEFCAGLAASRWRIGNGMCLQHAQRPYGPILDILAALDQRAGALSPQATKGEQFDAIVARFERAAAKTAVIAVVEDVHWADVATLELLAFLATKVERMRVLLVVSFRPNHLTLEDPSFAGFANLLRAARGGRVDLGPLDGPAIERLIEETAVGSTLSSETCRAVARTSEGNPFFAEELLKSAAERIANRAVGEAFPSSLRATLLERWRLLGDYDRRVLAQAAVIGRNFDIGLLAETLKGDIAGCVPTLARARDAQLVEELSPSEFRFRHALTRDAIYSEFLGAEVRPLHRTIAAALESHASDGRADVARHAEALAYHWGVAGNGELAARYNEIAGDAATSVNAHDDAIAFYQRVLDWESLDDRLRGPIIEKIAARYIALTLFERGHQTQTAAVRSYAHVGDFDNAARCLISATISASTIGLPDPTAPLHAMLATLEAGAHLARARLHLGIAWIAATIWNPTEASHHLGLIDERALSTHDIALRFHNISAWVAMTVGDLTTFRREYDAWVDHAERTSVTATASALYNGAWCFMTFGLHDEALALIDRAFDLAHAERNGNSLEATHSNASICHLMRGDLRRARAAVDAVPPKTENMASLWTASASGTLVAMHLDDRNLMATWFDSVGARVIENPDDSTGAGYAEILMRRGRPEEARRLLDRALRPCERPRGAVLTLLAAAKYADDDVVQRARVQLVACADAEIELVERPAVALFDAYVMQRQGRNAEALAFGREAVAGFERLTFPLLTAAAYEAAGEFESAKELYLACGAVGDVRRLRSRGIDDDAKPLLIDSSAADAAVTLTERELQIASLVARGKSNLEIARSLSISHKTVEKHLGAVYRKLGISSRAQLAVHISASA